MAAVVWMLSRALLLQEHDYDYRAR